MEILRPAPGRFLELTRLGFNLGLARGIGDRSPDLVVGFDWDGCFLPRRPHRRTVVALKGVAADERLHETGWNRIRFGLFSRLEKHNARRADRVVVTSEHSRRSALLHYGLSRQRVHVVPEGIDSAAWSNLPIRRPARDGPTVLSVARQYRRKNTASLIQAMVDVRRRVPTVRLRVVGDGPELPALRRMSSDLGLDDGTVQFMGTVPALRDLQSEFGSASLFALPSLQEGFGIVFLEAMAAGLPIVAARAGAVPEVAPHDEVALLVPPHDVAALSGAILRLLLEPDLAARLAAAGRKRWLRYGWTEVARRFLEAAGEQRGYEPH